MDTSDILILGTVIAISNGLVMLGDRLWNKKPGDQPSQPVVCGFQHKEISTLLIQQNDNLREMVAALRSMIEDSKLRHEIMLARLDKTHERVVSLHNDLNDLRNGR